MAQINSVFHFLKDFNELTNPIVTDVEKQVWLYRLSSLPQLDELWSIYAIQDYDNNKILEIKRPKLESCPKPDQRIVEWLEGDWQNNGIETIGYREIIEREKRNNDGTRDTYDEYFLDDEYREKLYDEWVEQRNFWRSREIAKEAGLVLYNTLFKLYSDIKRESESLELILGDGHICWNAEFGQINHPILLQKVILEFDPEKPSFTIKCEEIKAELYTSLLRSIPTINKAMLSDIVQDIELSTYHIADIANTKLLFERIINVVDNKGVYADTLSSGHIGPVIMSTPVLFVRKRTLGFSSFIENIIDEIENNPDIDIPGFFHDIIGNYRELGSIEPDTEDWNQQGIDQDILLTLPANNEQLKIIKYLNKYGAVLVQGPPGTGKTHTIANLIGHLLSQGSSVLVTSHTEKALTVLKDKVYKDTRNKDINLQNLCISLLSSSSQKKEMDTAINEIASKSTTLDLSSEKLEIERLKKNREELIARSKELGLKMLEIRSLEYKDLVCNNQTIKPIEAAKFINNGINAIDYIPGDTTVDTIGLPLSTDELIELYKTNSYISPDEQSVLDKDLPALESLWSPENTKINVVNYLIYSHELKEWNPYLDFINELDKSKLYSIYQEVVRLRSGLSEMDQLQVAIIDKTLKDIVYSSFWVSVFQEFDALLEGYEIFRKTRFENDYKIPNEYIIEETIIALDDILSTGKNPPVTLISTLTKPKWKKLKNEITNRNNPLDDRSDYKNVKVIIEYEIKRAKLINKINKLLLETSTDQQIDLNDFEEKARQYKKKIDYALSWYQEQWSCCIKDIGSICKNPKKYDELCVINLDNAVDSLRKLTAILVSDLTKRYHRELLMELDAEWASFELKLRSYRHLGNLFVELHEAVCSKNSEAYANTYYALSEVLAKRDISNRRNQLISQLKVVAPRWAQAILDREGVHGGAELPINIEDAWKWRQLSNQIARIDKYDINSIQKELKNVNTALLGNARRLVYHKAWYNKILKKSIKQTQAIEGWRQTIRQIGKGTGKNAPLLMKKARELMPLCQTAIPVWIMPLNRVVENFDPRNNKFDVVIIDEASQANILALSALYLGKHIIVVGDDEQVSPEPVKLKQEDIDAIIELHLNGVPNRHLYNGRTSVYDIAKASGFKPMMLTEHFRCLPEIIEFSNQLSYNGRIKPLRDSSRVNTRPYVVEYRVPNAYKSEGKVNEVEAEHIASLVCACIDDETYDRKTIGVISLLGQEQAYEIDKLLQRYLDPVVYEERKIQCGTASQFQGDERDIIFLSVVEGPRESGGPVRLLSEDGNNDLTRKKYNVAASRAKDQMWVVHSLNPEIDLKPDDIRLRLIKHSIDPAVGKNDAIVNVGESDFEKRVLATLLNKGYKVIPQWPVGAYRIDMVVVDGDRNIALECDGEKWHTQDNLADDLKRQAVLERLGWRFIRIRGSAYYRDPDKTMSCIFKELDDYEIRPSFTFTEVNETNNSSNEVIERVKRKAVQYRDSWHGRTFSKNSEQLGCDKVNETVQPRAFATIGESDVSDVTEAIPGGNDITAPEQGITKRKENLPPRELKQSLLDIEQPQKLAEVDEGKKIQAPRFDFRKK